MPSGGGWICVGFSSLATGFYASDISGFVNGAKVTMVCMWDPVSGSYDTYAPGISPPFLDFVVGPGDGCWLLLDGPATLTYSP